MRFFIGSNPRHVRCLPVNSRARTSVDRSGHIWTAMDRCDKYGQVWTELDNILSLPATPRGLQDHSKGEPLIRHPPEAAKCHASKSGGGSSHRPIENITQSMRSHTFRASLRCPGAAGQIRPDPLIRFICMCTEAAKPLSHLHTHAVLVICCSASARMLASAGDMLHNERVL